MTQKERIFNRLKIGEWLSSVEASRDMYIMRLGARIWDLWHDGHNIIERKVREKVGVNIGSSQRKRPRCRRRSRHRADAGTGMLFPS